MLETARQPTLGNLVLHIFQKEKIATKIAAKIALVNGPDTPNFLVFPKSWGGGCAPVPPCFGADHLFISIFLLTSSHLS